MKYWLDTEFIEAHGSIDIISLGVIAEDGREFYVESSEVNWDRASQWVLDNVKPYLQGVGLTRSSMGQKLIEFVAEDEPEFWAYYADYDWVAVCSLFGTMMGLPKNFPMFCLDLKQSLYTVGNPKLPSQDPDLDGPEHHALSDARWTKRSWEWLMSYDSPTNRSIEKFRDAFLQREVELLQSVFHSRVFTKPDVVRVWQKNHPHMTDMDLLTSKVLDLAYRQKKLKIHPPVGEFSDIRMQFVELV